MKREGKDVVVTRDTTYANRDNLAAGFFSQVISKYEGTRLGRQELNAELLEDTPGALWSLGLIEDCRIAREAMPALRRIVVAIDPAVSTGKDSDETGIIVAGIGTDGHGYVLDDLSGKMSPVVWAQTAIAAYHRYSADRITAEVNSGGLMVETTLRTVEENIPYTAIHASKGKVTRAEPVSALYAT